MDPLFGQVYVLDDIDEATAARVRGAVGRGRELNRGLLRQLEELIRAQNPFAQGLQSLGRQLAADDPNLPPAQHFRLSILDRRFESGQVFAVFDRRDNEGAPPDPRLCGIWLRSEGNRLQPIGLWNKNADWLLFPLMFPNATQTYGRGIPRAIEAGGDEQSGVPEDEEDMLHMIDEQTPGRAPTNSLALAAPLTDLPRLVAQRARTQAEEQTARQPDSPSCKCSQKISDTHTRTALGSFSPSNPATHLRTAAFARAADDPAADIGYALDTTAVYSSLTGFSPFRLSSISGALIGSL
jgi:hypothetical protein